MLEAITASEEAFLGSARGGEDRVGIEQAAWTLVRVYAARAEDARYGAGQIARGSQRAPTFEDCEDGWARVEEIVLGAEAFARRAETLATELGQPRAFRIAETAGRAAQKARAVIRERNHAYTFHADPGFSFGEGWYLGAAGVLAGVATQIEPNKPHSAAAELFLREAGLARLLVPYRSRPRANKALPEIVAGAFRADPARAQARLRAAFLGVGPIPEAVRGWIDGRLGRAPEREKVLLWVRSGKHQAERNTSAVELSELCRLSHDRGLVPVLIGDAIEGGEIPEHALDLTLFWRAPLFQSGNMRRAQLQLFEQLRREHGLVGQLGVTTAGMDGPALMGLPTMYLTERPNVRLGRWVGAVPGYEEIVRGPQYLERIAQTLERWRSLSALHSRELTSTLAR